jgi:hypothetical protein
MAMALPTHRWNVVASALYALLFVSVAHAQDAAQRVEDPLQSLSPTAEGVPMTGPGSETIGQVVDPHVCIDERRIPDRYHAPIVGVSPRSMARLGVSWGFEAAPLAGHSGRLVLHPIYNYHTAPVITLHITGPEGYDQTVELHMPMKELEVCEPIPNYPNSCNGPQATTRYYAITVQTPAFGAPGRYALSFSGSTRRGHSRNVFPVDLDAHPLADHVQLPEGVTAASRADAHLRVLVDEESVYSGRSLVVCGEDKRTRYCVRTSDVFPDCQVHLADQPEVLSRGPGSSEWTPHMLEHPAASESWCHGDRLVTFEHSHRIKGQRILREVQEVMPSGRLAVAAE